MKEKLRELLKDKRQTALLGLFVLTLSAGITALCLIARSSGASPVRFARVLPVSGQSTGKQKSASALSEGYPVKMPYERMRGGDTMYCTYFGRLSVRSGPSGDTERIGYLVYGDEVQTFWKEDSGYVRIVGKQKNSEESLDGYCIREELSEAAPSDGRVYLNVLDFKQYDERWADLPLGDSYETIKSAGCTTTCLAMAYSYLEGTVTTPAGMEERLWYNDDGMLGFPKVYGRYDGADYLSVVLEKLRLGLPVLVGGKNDDGGQHWVLVVGYSGDGKELHTGDFLIHDPASEERPTLTEFFAEYPEFNKIAYYNNP